MSTSKKRSPCCARISRRSMPGVIERSFATIEKSMPAKPVIVEAAVSNSDRLNIEAGFMKPDEKLGSYSDLFTNEYVQ